MPENLPREFRILQVPIAPWVWAAIRIPSPITASEWAQAMAVLEAMKPGLLADPAQELEKE